MTERGWFTSFCKKRDIQVLERRDFAIHPRCPTAAGAESLRKPGADLPEQPSKIYLLGGCRVSSGAAGAQGGVSWGPDGGWRSCAATTQMWDELWGKEIVFSL